jgi:DNA-binding NtrC family response regulator
MKNIAIVDDEQAILDVLERFLSRSGQLNIKTFSNPIIAFEELKQGNYDLVLLDIMMPQMDGIEFLQKIKNEKPEVEVVMMTAFSTLERTIAAHKYGAKNYLTKPFKDLKQVQDKVFKVLGI